MKTVNDVIESYNAGDPVDYLFFWGHSTDEPHEGCFSNWFPLEFTFEGETYPTAEHFMMYEKARFFNDERSLEKMKRETHPGSVKRLGRQVVGFDQEKWEAYIPERMVSALVEKFSQHADFKQYILDTGDSVLVEASPYDTVWGIGMMVTDDGIENPNNWKGRNLLGFVLMEARDRIRANESNL